MSAVSIAFFFPNIEKNEQNKTGCDTCPTTTGMESSNHPPTIAAHWETFRGDVRRFVEISGWTSCPEVGAVFQYLCDYPPPPLATTEKDTTNTEKTDTQKEKNNQCLAKRSTGTQCTRRKKKGSDFCGTHQKHANASNAAMPSPPPPAVVYTIREHNGIYYHIDSHGNICCAEDVLNEHPEPRILGTCVPTASGDFQWSLKWSLKK